MDERVDAMILIRKNSTGEVRTIFDKLYLDEDGYPNTYIWEDGNYGCDCNRALFFARVNDEEEDMESKCSTGLYSVDIWIPVYTELSEETNE